MPDKIGWLRHPPAGKTLPWHSVMSGSASLSEELLRANGLAGDNSSAIMARFHLYFQGNTSGGSQEYMVANEAATLRGSSSSTNWQLLQRCENRMASLEAFASWEHYTAAAMHASCRHPPARCDSMEKLMNNTMKHSEEITKMQVWGSTQPSFSGFMGWDASQHWKDGAPRCILDGSFFTLVCACLLLPEH